MREEWMIGKVKRGIKKLLGVVGLEVRGRRDSVERASMRGGLQQLARMGFKPRTVIDIGAAEQTTELYEQFKDADILLIEPLREFEPFLQEICKSYRAQYVLAAAGATAGTATFNVHRDKFGSSLLKEVEGSREDGTPREVPSVVIDELVVKMNLTGPYLIKLDVQGAELQVLAGAKQVLKEAEAILMELSLINTMIGGAELVEVVAWMKRICGFLYRPLDNALCQVDAVFVREEGLFRVSHAFATPEQRTAINRDRNL
jgi:FkbM family methyltransferase